MTSEDARAPKRNMGRIYMLGPVLAWVALLCLGMAIPNDEPRFTRPLIRDVSLDLNNQGAMQEYTGVYFVKWGDYIKVGTAFNVVTRRRSLQSGLPSGEVVGLGWIRNGYLHPRMQRFAQEGSIHRQLAKYHARGEWFQNCDAVRAFISRVAEPWPT